VSGNTPAQFSGFIIWGNNLNFHAITATLFSRNGAFHVFKEKGRNFDAMGLIQSPNLLVKI
jgi:hypothetical protein